MSAFDWISPELLGVDALVEAVIDWCRAVTVPVAELGVPPTPPALPTPVTVSPTLTESESPKLAVARPEALSA